MWWMLIPLSPDTLSVDERTDPPHMVLKKQSQTVSSRAYSQRNAYNAVSGSDRTLNRGTSGCGAWLAWPGQPAAPCPLWLGTPVLLPGACARPWGPGPTELPLPASAGWPTGTKDHHKCRAMSWQVAWHTRYPCQGRALCTAPRCADACRVLLAPLGSQPRAPTAGTAPGDSWGWGQRPSLPWAPPAPVGPTVGTPGADARAGTSPCFPRGHSQVCRVWGMYAGGDTGSHGFYWQPHIPLFIFFSPPSRNLQLKLIHKLQPRVRHYK